MLENRCPASRRQHLRCARRCAAPRAARSRERQALPSRAQRPVATGQWGKQPRGVEALTQLLGTMGAHKWAVRGTWGGHRGEDAWAGPKTMGSPLARQAKRLRHPGGRGRTETQVAARGRGPLVLKPGSQPSPKYPVFLVSFQQVFFS